MKNSKSPQFWGSIYMVFLSAATLLCGMSRTSADVTNYFSSRRQVKVCVLVSNASVLGNAKENGTPHLFYILDKRTDLKPAGWNLVNPLASSSITQAMINEWSARNPADPAFTAGTREYQSFQVGSQLGKNMAAYWEVDLDSVSQNDLSQFDLVLIASSKAISFSPDEREKLRHYADAGGTIWLEDEGGLTISNSGSFLLPVMNFSGAIGTVSLPFPPANHPIINYPYSLSNTDVLRLGAGGSASRHALSAITDPNILGPVVLTNGLPFVSAGDFGAGHLLVSSSGSASSINDRVGGYGANRGVISGETFLNAPVTDLKFSYNILSWLSSIPSANANVRRSTSISENIGSTLGLKWASIDDNVTDQNPGTGAVVAKGMAYYVDNLNIIHAFDTNPDQSLSGRQLIDDGIPDHSFGAPFDEVWRADLKTITGTGANDIVSTPTIVSVWDAINSRPLDVLTVTTATGVTVAFNARPQDASGNLLGTTTILWQRNGPTTGNLSPSLTIPRRPASVRLFLPAPSPAYSEGVLFTVQHNSQNSLTSPWRIVPVDPVTGNNVFGADPNPNSDYRAGYAPPVLALSIGLNDVVGNVSVGYVKDDSTGAIDKIVYVPTHDGANGSANPDSVMGMWFSTRKEPMLNNGSPSQFRATLDRGQVPWWAPAIPLQSSASPSLLPVLHEIDANGSEVKTYYYSKGDFTVNFLGTQGARDMVAVLPAAIAAGNRIFADYTVDWSAIKIGGTIPVAQDFISVFRTRSFVTFNPSGTQEQLLTGTPVLSSSDDLLVSVFDTRTESISTKPAPDRICSFHDQVIINKAVTPAIGSKMNWMFSPPNGGVYGTDTISPRLVNQTGQSLTGYKAIGNVAESNGIIYSLGNALVGNTSHTVILALKSHPTLSFTVNKGALPADITTVSLQQVDTTRYTNASNQSQYVKLMPGVNFTADTDTDTITITDFRSGGNSFSLGNGASSGSDSFNTALPITLVVNGNPVERYPAGNGKAPLDNLLWYIVIPQPTLGNSTTRSGPSIIGSSLYFGLENGNVVSVDLPIDTPSGLVPLLFSNGVSRVHIQSTIAPLNPAITSNPVINAPLGSANVVYVGTPRGLAALDNRLTTIADNTRLIEVNWNGDAVWSVDSTNSFGITGGILGNSGNITQTKVAFSRPSVVRRTSISDYLVVDTGNNRVLQMDKGSGVTWEIHSVSNELQVLRPGDPLTLNQPSDVEVFTEVYPQNGVNYSIVNRDSGVTYTSNGNSYVVHYLIADSGNFRNIEVVDAYSSNGAVLVMTGSDGSSASMQHQVVFTTRSLSEQNLKYHYRTIQEFIDPSSKKLYMLSAVDNVRQSARDSGTVVTGLDGGGAEGPGGSIAVIQRDFNSNAQANKDGYVSTIVNSIAIVDANGTIVRHQAIHNPTYFKEFSVGTNAANTTPRYLMADASGCYVLRPTSVNGKAEAVVEWMVSSEDYYHLTGRRLIAASIRRLNQADYDANTMQFYPHYLITNSYTGPDNVKIVFNAPNITRGDIHGEVFEIRSRDYYLHVDANNMYDGYSTTTINNQLYRLSNGTLTKNTPVGTLPGSAIVWLIPNETFPAAQGPIKRSIGSGTGGTSTSLLEQPQYSDRPF